MVHNYKMSEFSEKGEGVVVHTSSISYEGQLPEHKHFDFMEIFYVTKGKGTHILNGQKSAIKKGELGFLAFNSKHTLEAKTNDFEWVDIIFNIDAISSTLSQCNSEDLITCSILRHFQKKSLKNQKDIILHNVSGEFAPLIKLILKEYLQKEKGYMQNLRCFVSIILIKIFRLLKVSEFEELSYEGSKLIDIVLEELKNSNYKISMDSMAKKACLGYKYFSQSFKKHTGINFTEFVQRKRMEKACELLTFTDYSTSMIVESVGLSDNKSFYKVFKKYVGTTPQRFRIEKVGNKNNERKNSRKKK